jgi:hypothetical protein
MWLEGLGKLDQAEEYLLQARWTVLKTPECPNTIKHKLCRHLGLLYAAKGQFDKALQELAYDVSYLALFFAVAQGFTMRNAKQTNSLNYLDKLIIISHFKRLFQNCVSQPPEISFL